MKPPIKYTKPKLKKIDVLRDARIHEVIKKMKSGQAISDRDLRYVLTPEEYAEYQNLWKEQQNLRKAKRARTLEQQKELGWKSKFDVRLEVLERAYKFTKDNLVETYELAIRQAEINQLHYYYAAFEAAKAHGKTTQEASVFANNELQRAGYNRLHPSARVPFLNERDIKMREMEAKILGEWFTETEKMHIADYESRNKEKCEPYLNLGLSLEELMQRLLANKNKKTDGTAS